MKKTFLFLALASIAITSCRKDGEEIVPEVNIETQNTNDDVAAKKFLETHYLDAKGNLKEYVDTDVINVKLSKLNPVTLPSGVIYIMRPNAQPNPGKEIGSSDIITLMSNSMTYVATDTDGNVAFTSPYSFRNTINGSGIPELDPAYFHVKDDVLKNGKTEIEKQRNFYEIEGFIEALQKFKAYDLPNESNYNLQGVIIVPSRAAFARDAHFNYNNISFKDRSFIFNFQVYKTTPR
ncbi:MULTISPECIES: hypothetical protein [Chryseobacterium]|uniref:Uncharacterized protein n=1 Tax=Chryseobacterium salivictor TaxID=2547600 RepID=A0A4P6ZCF6_9FLAO|nr:MULTISPECIES: hypothetical protein [Chryseobacterium]MDQ0477604.1 hypothetical protein [Chryseobacterium sp. MDT2-18]QBO57069.1 hypothetical protein NBC122_00214 [Chryseobacterium salivictor]